MWQNFLWRKNNTEPSNKSVNSHRLIIDVLMSESPYVKAISTFDPNHFDI